MYKRKGFSKFIRKVEKIQGVKQTYDVGNTNFMAKRKKDIEPFKLSWVMDAFTWATTPQGSNFWTAIYNGIGDQELACEILESWREQGYV